MLCIHNKSTNPYFNLATEEYLFKNKSEDIFMLWRNEPSIIVGKHQNTLSEINYEFVRENNIKVVRRLTGGGAVFHDLGNVNFTFIQTGEDEKLVDFRKYTAPIIDVLKKIGIEAKFEGRNDLTIDGKKFSGNAEHIFKNRILHHGTLLFSATMNNLTQALKVDESKFNDKAVKSVRSRVTNISEHLPNPLSVEEFIDLIYTEIKQMYNDAIDYELTPSDIAQIEKLVAEKYSTWEWNYGYVSNYNFSNKVRTNAGTIEINMEINNGIIEKIKFYGDYFSVFDTEDLEAKLINVQHREDEIRKALTNVDLNKYFHNLNESEFYKILF